MGTHPIFESDFDCLTEICSLNETIEKQLIVKFSVEQIETSIL